MDPAEPPPPRTPQPYLPTEERYRLVIECVRDYAIFMLDARGVITTWNVGAENIKGWKAAEILGRHFSVFYPPEDVASGKPDWELEEAARVGRFEDEGWRVRRDGSQFWANVVITALRDGAGRLVGYGKVTRDLTERRRAEEDRLQLARAEEAVRVRDHFVAMLSHELRNPLAPIRNSLHLVARAPPGSPLARRAIEVIERQVLLLGGIIEELIDLSRVVRGSMEVARAPVDLAALVSAAVEDHAGVFQERGVALETRLPPEPLWVEGDPTRLAQIVGNLLQNARKFTPAGGHVTVSLGRAGAGKVRLGVRDDGEGMEPGILGKVFQPFVQADRTLARSQGGLGLGLALVKGLAALHGGEVSAASDGPGRGSEFVVTLPLARSSAGAAVPPARPNGSPRRVLVVDDNEDAAESLAELLRLLGHEVSVSRDGEAALAQAQRLAPDVVLCDLGLPGLDGYEVARRIRATPALARTLLVAVSGYAGEAEVRRALAAGFDRHLAKPADPLELERIVG